MQRYPVERLRRIPPERARDLTRWARSAPIGALMRGADAARGWLGAPIDVRLGVCVRWDESSVERGSFVLLEGGDDRLGLWLEPRI